MIIVTSLPAKRAWSLPVSYPCVFSIYDDTDIDTCDLIECNKRKVYSTSYIVKDGTVGITRKKNGGPYILQIFNPLK